MRAGRGLALILALGARCGPAPGGPAPAGPPAVDAPAADAGVERPADARAPALDGGLADSPAPDARGADAAAAEAPVRDAASEAAAPAACARAPRSLLCRPLGELPARLSETGLLVRPPDLASVAPEAVPFRPRWELWSNGLEKERHLVLPPGEVIDNRDRRRWTLSPGALLWKTFFGLRDGRRYPVETRLLRRAEGRWEYAAYLWSADGADARLLDGTTSTPVRVRLGDAAFEHQVPSRSQCRECHEANETVPIGLDELRLNWTPGGARQTELEALAGRGLFRAPLPVDPERIVTAEPGAEAILGYVHGNCAHCHNGDRAFDLRHRVFLENTIRRPTSSPGTPSGLRIAPGEPDRSILFLGFARLPASGVNPMPPLGVERRDDEMVERLRRWIAALR